MSTPEPLSPWAEGNHDDSPPEPLARLFAVVPQPAPLGDVARQRVAVRLRSHRSRGAGLVLLRLVAVGVVIGLSGAAAAQWATVHWLGAREVKVTGHSEPVVAAPPVVAPPSRSRVSAPSLPEAAALEPPSPEPASSPVSSAPTGAVAGASSRLGQEATSLAAALSALKAGGRDNAGRALQAIERHLQAFPGGALELEARVARVDALLVLGRRQDARRELSALPIDRIGRQRELRLIRAELRADDDCRGALSDFQVLVEQPLPAPWAERALFGRGACLLKLGDKAAAQRDFDRYLAGFPNGRFAEQIRAQARP